MSEESTPSFQLAGKLVLLALVIAVVGLPINDLIKYTLVLIVVVVLCTGQLSNRPARWVAAAALAATAIVGQSVLNPTPIEEGHNVFLPEGGDALVNGLPPDVYRLIAAEFDAVYPPNTRCNREIRKCWRSEGFPNRTFAFSADGLLDNPAYSRRVSTINFDDPVWLRLGFTNEEHYKWNSDVSELKRLRRDGRFWRSLHRWRLLMPWFVMYQLPPEFVGGSLCWRGDVIWEEQKERYSMLRNPMPACRTITPDDIGRRIFGVAIRPGTLAMKLDPPLSVSLRQFASFSLAAGAVGGLVALLVSWKRRASSLPFLLITLALAIIAITDGSFIGGYRPLDDGEDSLIYEGMARRIAENLRLGNLMLALEGGEKVFFFGGSGFLYPRAIERVLFGDTNLGYLSLVLSFPILMFAVFRRLLSVRWALALAVIFVAVPIGALFGTSFFHYATWAVRGYADPAGVIAGVAGFLVLIGRDAQKPSQTVRSAFAASLLFALSILLRPNGAIFAAVMLTGAGLAMLYQRQWSRYVALCVGFLPVTLLGLHNWYFGGVFVPFNSNWTHPEALVMPPSAWLAAFGDMVRLNWGGENVAAALKHLGTWLAGPSERLALVPVHAAAIAILIAVAVRGTNYDPWVRLAALATLLQHLGALCYAITPRYHLAAWLFTYLIVVVWIRQTGIVWFQRTFPLRYDRMYNHPFTGRLRMALKNLQLFTGKFDEPVATRG